MSGHGLETVTVQVHGLVQGVGYRYFVIRHSSFLKLTGYVRNNNGGSVEIVAEGESSHIDDLLSLLKQGPSMAEVETVDIIERRSIKQRKHRMFMIVN